MADVRDNESQGGAAGGAVGQRGLGVKLLSTLAVTLKAILCALPVAGLWFALTSTPWQVRAAQQGKAPDEPSCFNITVRLNGKPIEGPRSVTLKTNRNEMAVSPERGCFRVPPDFSSEKHIDVSLEAPGNKLIITGIETDFFIGVWEIDLEDRKFEDPTALPKHVRAKDACVITFHNMRDEPERRLSVAPCRFPRSTK